MLANPNSIILLESQYKKGDPLRNPGQASCALPLNSPDLDKSGDPRKKKRKKHPSNLGNKKKQKREKKKKKKKEREKKGGKNNGFFTAPWFGPFPDPTAASARLRRRSFFGAGQTFAPLSFTSAWARGESFRREKKETPTRVLRGKKRRSAARSSGFERLEQVGTRFFWSCSLF